MCSVIDFYLLSYSHDTLRVTVAENTFTLVHDSRVLHQCTWNPPDYMNTIDRFIIVNTGFTNQVWHIHARS